MPSPETSLDSPIYFGGDVAQIVFGDRIAARTNWRQVENRFLKVWGKVEQVHDLGDACAGDVADRGEIGLRRDGAFPNKGVESDRQRHQPGDAGNTPRQRRWR